MYILTCRWDLDKGNVSSVYMKLFQRNHCNHRDYQNLAKNGADSFDVNDILLKSFNRRKGIDQPALVFYALMGNDVCNHWHNLDHMTTPQQMRTNLLKTLHTLDKQLPDGSHIVFVGMVDGRLLYNSMHNRIHPIGSLRRDVTYSQFYDFFNCLDISPCYGYLNTNETVRNLTAERTFALTAVMKDVAEHSKYDSFDMVYLENPWHQVVKVQYLGIKLTCMNIKVYFSVKLSACPSVCFFIYIHVYLFVCLPKCTCRGTIVPPFVATRVHVQLYLSVCLSPVSVPAHLSVCLPVHIFLSDH